MKVRHIDIMKTYDRILHQTELYMIATDKKNISILKSLHSARKEYNLTVRIC